MPRRKCDEDEVDSRAVRNKIVSKKHISQYACVCCWFWPWLHNFQLPLSTEASHVASCGIAAVVWRSHKPRLLGSSTVFDTVFVWQARGGFSTFGGDRSHLHRQCLCWLAT